MSLVTMALAFASVSARAQEHPIHWRVDEVAASVPAGTSTTLKVHATIDSPWHLYSLTQPRPPIATVISVGPARFFHGQRGRQPKPAKQYDPNFEIQSELFTGSVVFEVPVAVAASAKPGKYDAFVAVLYQTCTDRVCLPPAHDTVAVALTVAAALPGTAAASATIDAAPTQASNQPIVEGDSAPAEKIANPAVTATARNEMPALPADTNGLWAFVTLAAVMGGLALLTPCVFPMIPITVSYFTRRQQDASGRADSSRGTRDAFVYASGIILAFSALGLFLAMVFGATGINRFAANPWVNLLVAALFVGFALDLLGVFEFRLPWRLLNRLDSESKRGGLPGILLMGVVFAVTTFTCTVPFVGTLLVTAATGDWVWPLVGMVVFSTVFALPFFVLALVPKALVNLPRSGSWMGALKVTLGLIEMGAAVKFLSNVDLVWQLGILHRPVVIAVWIAISALISLYLLGRIRLTSEHGVATQQSIGIGRFLSGGAFLAFSVFLASGLVGRPLGEVEAFLPPLTYPGDESSHGSQRAGELAWVMDFDDGLAKARTMNRPIFVDFTGYTCTNCRWMEANIFSRPDIQELFSNYVLIRLFTDGQGDKYTRNRDLQLKRFGTVALPLYAILNSSGDNVAALSGLTRSPEKFASFLREPLKQTQVVGLYSFSRQ